MSDPNDPAHLITAISILEAYLRKDTDGYFALVDHLGDDVPHVIAALCDITTSELEASSGGHALHALEAARRLLDEAGP